MVKHKVLHRAFFDGNTIVTVNRPLGELKVGTPINDGTHKVISVVLGINDIDNISLVIDGKFVDDEVVYG